MRSTHAHYRKRAVQLLRVLALSIATVAIIGMADIAPAKAWYDAYGYWHPNHHWHHRHWSAWRHHWWCERHPYACGYRRY